MKAYKGFKRDMTCRGFQYEEGKSYETDDAIVCESGFHACEDPLDCFDYYSPDGSVYHEVELDGNIDKSGEYSNVASTRIKIGPRMSIADLVKAEIDFVVANAGSGKRSRSSTSKDFAHAATSDKYANTSTSGLDSHASTSGDHAHAATSGDYAHAATSGDFADASTSGDHAHAATSGDCSNAATSGDCSNAATSGDDANAATAGNWAHAATYGNCARASTSGDFADASTSGDCAHAATSGYCSHAVTSGRKANASASGDFASAEVKGSSSVAAVFGRGGSARGAMGCWLVLTERDIEMEIIGVKAIRIDGRKYKPDTWYELRDGKVVKRRTEDEGL